MAKQLKQILENLFNREFSPEEVATFEVAIIDLLDALKDPRENLPVIDCRE